MKIEKQIKIVQSLLDGILELEEHQEGWYPEYKKGKRLLSYLKELQKPQCEQCENCIKIINTQYNIIKIKCGKCGTYHFPYK